MVLETVDKSCSKNQQDYAPEGRREHRRRDE